MIDVDEALRIVFANTPVLPAEPVPLAAALHRTLASSVACDVDYPPFDRSVMDGYAVRSADVAAAPVQLRVVEQIAAGAAASRPLESGEAMQINTGAPIPEGADAVVRVELTELAGEDGVVIRASVPAGKFITPQATYVSAGHIVLDAGIRLGSLEIAAAATAGAAHLSVHRQPTIAILGTGDELIDIDRLPTGAQIRNSNQYLLESLVREAHARPVVLGVAKDDRAALRTKITEGLQNDVLCLTGGVSMGAFDFVPEVLESCGVSFHIRKMAIKPGRPTIFGTAADGTLVFALPGNPASALVGFELLVRPALAALAGRSGGMPALVRAVLRGSIGATRDRRTYRPAVARVMKDGAWQVEPLSWHGSGDSFGMIGANALIESPPEARAMSSGEVVSVWLLGRT